MEGESLLFEQAGGEVEVVWMVRCGSRIWLGVSGSRPDRTAKLARGGQDECKNGDLTPPYDWCG